MALIRITGLDGTAIGVESASIFRMRGAQPSEADPSTKVDYSGGYIFTPESVDSLIGRIGDKPRFVAFTARNGGTIHLNSGSISRVREALPINGPGTEITVAGRFQHVIEPLATVLARLEG